MNEAKATLRGATTLTDDWLAECERLRAEASAAIDDWLRGGDTKLSSIVVIIDQHVPKALALLRAQAERIRELEMRLSMTNTYSDAAADKRRGR